MPFITLSSQDDRTDREMRRALYLWLKWGRTYAPEYFKFYVVVPQLQARGVLHFHVVLGQRIPKRLMLKLRELWVDTYAMGPGAFDIRAMRSAKGAAGYLGKYLTGDETVMVPVPNVGGLPKQVPWRVSRHNGKPYARLAFEGNGHQLSNAARFVTRPVTEFVAPWWDFPWLWQWHGVHVFYESAQLAEADLAAMLTPPPLESG